MNVLIADIELESLILTGTSKKYKKVVRNKSLLDGLINTYNILCVESSTENLKNYSYLHYEKLKYEYTGFSSIRIKNNSVERLIFTEDENGITVTLIELEDNHYGNK